jgi:glucose-6-phosphate isomerase
LGNVHDIRNRIDKFSNEVRSGKFVGASGKSLKNLVVIGIGGSYLSIEFVY